MPGPIGAQDANVLAVPERSAAEAAESAVWHDLSRSNKRIIPCAAWRLSLLVVLFTAPRVAMHKPRDELVSEWEDISAAEADMHTQFQQDDDGDEWNTWSSAQFQRDDGDEWNTMSRYLQRGRMTRFDNPRQTEESVEMYRQTKSRMLANEGVAARCWEFEIHDSDGSDWKFEFVDASTNNVAASGTTPTSYSYSYWNEAVCLSSGCYSFQVTNSTGFVSRLDDGMVSYWYGDDWSYWNDVSWAFQSMSGGAPYGPAFVFVPDDGDPEGPFETLESCMALSKSVLDGCDFEDGWCGWTSSDQSYSYYSWTRNSGSTGSGLRSSQTGPIADHTYGVDGYSYGSYWVDGHYAYVDASSPNYPGAGPFTLESPDLSDIASGASVLIFYYSMYGSGMGTLRVDTFNGTTWTTQWSISGDQETADWQMAKIELWDMVNCVRFVGTTGSSWASDMAVDDIAIYALAPSALPTPSPTISSFPTTSMRPSPVPTPEPTSACNNTQENDDGTFGQAWDYVSQSCLPCPCNSRGTKLCQSSRYVAADVDDAFPYASCECRSNFDPVANCKTCVIPYKGSNCSEEENVDASFAFGFTVLIALCVVLYLIFGPHTLLAVLANRWESKVLGPVVTVPKGERCWSIVVWNIHLTLFRCRHQNSQERGRRAREETRRACEEEEAQREEEAKRGSWKVAVLQGEENGGRERTRRRTREQTGDRWR